MPTLPSPGLSNADRLAIGGIALALRLLLLVLSTGDPLFSVPMLDAEYAVDWGRAVAGGDVWGSPEGTAYFRTPLYAWFLAAAFRLPGPDLAVARILQALLGALAAVLLADLAARRHSRTAGWGTGLLAGASWTLLVFDRELLIAPIAFVAGAMALSALDGAWNSPNPLRSLAAGALVGLAAITRPNFALLVPVAAGLAFLAERPGRLRRTAALLLGAAVVIAPITVRNRVVSGEWIPLSFQAGLNLWIGNQPEADGMSATLPGFSSWLNEDVDAMLARESGRALSPREQDAHFRALALQAFREDPARVTVGLLRKTYLFLQGYEIRNNQDLYALRERSWLLSLPLPDWGWVLPLAVVGLVAIPPGRRRGLVPVLAYAVVMAVGPILFFVCARYRLPAWPAYLVLAGVGVAALVGPRVTRSVRIRSAVLLVAVALLARIDFLDIRHPDQSQIRFQYGNVHARLGQDEEAERELREALAIAPGFAEARHHLGALLLRQGRFREAIPELERAVRELPTSFRARRSLAEAWEAAGRPDLAVPIRREIVELRPGEPEELFSLATTLGMAGEYYESLALFRQLDDTELRNDPDFLLNAGQTALAIKKEGPGREWLERATRLPEAREAAYDALARYYLSLRRWDEGLGVLSEGLLRLPESASLIELRARARHATGDATGAIEDWEHLLRLVPDHAGARDELEALRSGNGS